MKKLVLGLICLLSVSMATAQKDEWWLKGFTYFQHLDKDHKVLEEREVTVSLSWNDKEMIFINDEVKLNLKIVSVVPSMINGYKTKLYTTRDNKGEIFIEIFEDAECGVIFTIPDYGIFGFYPHKPE